MFKQHQIDKIKPLLKSENPSNRIMGVMMAINEKISPLELATYCVNGGYYMEVSGNGRPLDKDMAHYRLSEYDIVYWTQFDHKVMLSKVVEIKKNNEIKRISNIKHEPTQRKKALIIQFTKMIKLFLEERNIPYTNDKRKNR